MYINNVGVNVKYINTPQKNNLNTSKLGTLFKTF